MYLHATSTRLLIYSSTHLHLHMKTCKHLKPFCIHRTLPGNIYLTPQELPSLLWSYEILAIILCFSRFWPGWLLSKISSSITYLSGYWIMHTASIPLHSTQIGFPPTTQNGENALFGKIPAFHRPRFALWSLLRVSRFVAMPGGHLGNFPPGKMPQLPWSLVYHIP